MFAQLAAQIALALVAGFANPVTTLDAGVGLEIAQDALPEVQSLVLARTVSDREPVGTSTAFVADGQRVYAHMKVDCPTPEATLVMVWRRDGRIIQSLPLTVKKSPRWRTWSYKTLRKHDVGTWTVEVLDEEGTVLADTRFVVKAAPTAAEPVTTTGRLPSATPHHTRRQAPPSPVDFGLEEDLEEGC